jgi:hypothetical protein
MLSGYTVIVYGACFVYHSSVIRNSLAILGTVESIFGKFVLVERGLELEIETVCILAAIGTCRPPFAVYVFWKLKSSSKAPCRSRATASEHLCPTAGQSANSTSRLHVGIVAARTAKPTVKLCSHSYW